MNRGALEAGATTAINEWWLSISSSVQGTSHDIKRFICEYVRKAKGDNSLHNLHITPRRVTEFLQSRKNITDIHRKVTFDPAAHVWYITWVQPRTYNDNRTLKRSQATVKMFRESSRNLQKENGQLQNTVSSLLSTVESISTDGSMEALTQHEIMSTVLLENKQLKSQLCTMTRRFETIKTKFDENQSAADRLRQLGLTNTVHNVMTDIMILMLLSSNI